MISFFKAAGLGIMTVAGLLAQPAVDYTFFKEQVQPILLKKRPGHARCVSCHEHGSPPLEPLAEGTANWNEEQSRKNFAVWKQFIVPGAPGKSKMLTHALVSIAGGARSLRFQLTRCGVQLHLLYPTACQNGPMVPTTTGPSGFESGTSPVPV